MTALLMIVSTVYVPSCFQQDPEVAFYIVDGYTFSRAEQRSIRTIAEAAMSDARVLLPTLPRSMIIRVNPGTKVIDEIGSSSSHSVPNVVYWTVDPTRPEGVSTIAGNHLRAALFYHFHHLVRLQQRRMDTLMDHVIAGGMAVAFERDSGGRAYPWSEYPADVEDWAKELMAVPPTASLDSWMFRHPDGRRWMGLRAGTYVVDQAMRASGKTAAELVSASTDDVLQLAGLR